VFLRFDLGSLPAGAVVQSVTIEAHAFRGYARTRHRARRRRDGRFRDSP
jgi:hypothetical protein